MPLGVPGDGGPYVIKSPFLESVREEAREEERTRSRAKAIVDFLSLRFPGQLPADLSATIEHTRDRVCLDQWFKLAATAPTLDDFRRDGNLIHKEAEVQARATLIVEVLGLRFPGQLPADLSSTIEQSRDRLRLDQWFKLAATAATLDDFRRDANL
jgi:hypothetical protein